MRIGAVNYLNSKPLVYGLEALAPDVRLTFDLPSRLADSLAAGRLDVALIPSVEFFRSPACTIISDACVACAGPVLSVKLYFRVPPREVKRVALDEGSRTSAALTHILLAEQCGIKPQWEPLPIGSGLETTDADAILLIGDRAIADCGVQRAGPTTAPNGGEDTPARIDDNEFVEVWDLGQRWTDWTGLPFVFAMWVARAGVDANEVSKVLGTARDDGRRHLLEIATREAPLVGITHELAMQYLSENLHFVLGKEEFEGLNRFRAMCIEHGLAPGEMTKVVRAAASRRLSGKFGLPADAN